MVDAANVWPYQNNRFNFIVILKISVVYYIWCLLYLLSL